MTTQFTDRQVRLAHLLFRLGAIQTGAFKLKLHEKEPDAPLSPIFLNLRTPTNPKPGPLTFQAVELIGQELSELVDRANIHFDYVVGLPRAGDPLAEAFFRMRPGRCKAPLYMEKEEKDGKRRISRLLPGEWRRGHQILLLDDLITEADSKLEAATVVRHSGCAVDDVVVLVDREQGGKQQLFRASLTLHSVWCITDLLDFYAESGLITTAKRDEVLTYLAAQRKTS